MRERAGHASAEEYRDFVDKIGKARFGEALDVHDRKLSDAFLREKAMGAGGFVISVSEGENRIWYRYRYGWQARENGRTVLGITYRSRILIFVELKLYRRNGENCLFL